MLKPLLIFKKALGHTCNDSVVLAGQEDLQETAGIIDQGNKLVLISGKFSPQMQNFIAAHELGHAIFHKQTVMHRDLPIDGVGQVKGVSGRNCRQTSSLFIF